MFGRQVTMKLKPHAAAELTRIADGEIVTILRRHQGFREEIIFIAPERAEAIANSLWDTPEDAEVYDRTGYPEVLKALANVIEGTPNVKTFDFVAFTLNQTFAGKLS